MTTRYIYDDNDYVEFAGPIKGLDPTTGDRELYHGADVVALIAATAASNTPIGGLTQAVAEHGDTGRYLFAFDGAAITAALSALADGAVVYRVLRAPGNFRVAQPLVYKKVRPPDAE